MAESAAAASRSEQLSDEDITDALDAFSRLREELSRSQRGTASAHRLDKAALVDVLADAAAARRASMRPAEIVVKLKERGWNAPDAPRQAEVHVRKTLHDIAASLGSFHDRRPGGPRLHLEPTGRWSIERPSGGLDDRATRLLLDVMGAVVGAGLSLLAPSARPAPVEPPVTRHAWLQRHVDQNQLSIFPEWALDHVADAIGRVCFQQIATILGAARPRAVVAVENHEQGHDVSVWRRSRKGGGQGTASGVSILDAAYRRVLTNSIPILRFVVVGARDEDWWEQWRAHALERVRVGERVFVKVNPLAANWEKLLERDRLIVAEHVFEYEPVGFPNNMHVPQQDVGELLQVASSAIDGVGGRDRGFIELRRDSFVPDLEALQSCFT